MTKPILEVDAKGWKRIQSTIPKFRLLLELYQNAKDEPETRNISITIKQESRYAEFKVEDDGPGFADLKHAYVLFAPSAKLTNNKQSGFMNMGEKSVVVSCEELTIHTTSGMVVFDMTAGTREEYPRRKRTGGTVVTGRLKMSREEYDQTIEVLHTICLPAHINLTVNGESIQRRVPIRSFLAKLPTRVMLDGELVTRTVETEVELHLVKDYEKPMLYEMGIPVVDIDMKYSVNVLQKVPLTKDRDNVPPAFLQTLNVLVLNETHDLLQEADASDSWVRAAAADERVQPESIKRVMDLRFGKKRVAFSPVDLEANNRSVAEGFTLIHGRTLTTGERENAKKFDLLPNAHEVFPTPKPYSNDPNATPVEVVPRDQWTPGMHKVAEYAQWIAKRGMGCVICVRYVKAYNFSAAYGSRCLDFNIAGLGEAWFDKINQEVDALIIHELAHEYESNHLSENYYNSLCRVGAEMVQLVIEYPDMFRHFKGCK